MGRSGECLGTVQMSCRCTGGSMGEGLILAGKWVEGEDLNQLWALVKETLNIRPATSDKDIELWVELKRLEGLPPQEGSGDRNDKL
nr:hypothetical protein [Tanacetum cinerariifolium]